VPGPPGAPEKPGIPDAAGPAAGSVPADVLCAAATDHTAGVSSSGTSPATSARRPGATASQVIAGAAVASTAQRVQPCQDVSREISTNAQAALSAIASGKAVRRWWRQSSASPAAETAAIAGAIAVV
jgi:hypothetical protein